MSNTDKKQPFVFEQDKYYMIKETVLKQEAFTTIMVDNKQVHRVTAFTQGHATKMSGNLCELLYLGLTTKFPELTFEPVEIEVES